MVLERRPWCVMLVQACWVSVAGRHRARASAALHLRPSPGPHRTTGTFDPSLMLVMGGALLVSVPIFQAVLRFKTCQRPVCAPCFDLPSKSHIDAPLVLGALLFGAGESRQQAARVGLGDAKPNAVTCCRVVHAALALSVDWAARRLLTASWPSHSCHAAQAGALAGCARVRAWSTWRACSPRPSRWWWPCWWGCAWRSLSAPRCLGRASEARSCTHACCHTTTDDSSHLVIWGPPRRRLLPTDPAHCVSSIGSPSTLILSKL